MKIAWLEQSGLLQDRKELREQLNKVDVDYYRLNWRHGDEDPFANINAPSGKRISWSKGREQLYNSAKSNDYDYYIFADDDLILDRSVADFIRKIKDSLSEYQPCLLTVRGDSWHERFLPKTTKSIVSIFIVDLQFQCLSRRTAEFAFPVKFDGGWGTLWYPMLNCNKTLGTVVNIRDMVVKNSASTAQGEYGGVENKNVDSIWDRSRPYMSNHAWLLSKLVGHRKTIIYLNWAYATLVPVKKNALLDL